jgi:hypothetical protein
MVDSESKSANVAVPLPKSTLSRICGGSRKTATHGISTQRLHSKIWKHTPFYKFGRLSDGSHLQKGAVMSTDEHYNLEKFLTFRLRIAAFWVYPGNANTRTSAFLVGVAAIVDIIPRDLATDYVNDAYVACLTRSSRSNMNRQPEECDDQRSGGQ